MGRWSRAAAAAATAIALAGPFALSCAGPAAQTPGAPASQAANRRTGAAAAPLIPVSPRVSRPKGGAPIASSSPPATRPATGTATATGGRFLVGRLQDPAITESSGIVASRKYPGVFWTHNDSGNPPDLFAVTRDGKLIARIPVAATNRDWEDIAIDDAGHLYIAETGNNGHTFAEVYVYRIDEPDPLRPRNPDSPPLKVTRTWRLRFPDGPFDCESLFTLNGKGYVISKLLTYQPAVMYQFDLGGENGQKEPAVLEPVVTLPIRFPVTAADVTPDGKWLAVMSVGGPYLFQIDGDVANAAKVKPAHVTFVHPKIEAVCFVAEGLLATTEDRQVFLFRYEQFGLTGGRPTTKPHGVGE